MRNYRLLVPIRKHIKQYRRMITHRASEFVFCIFKSGVPLRRPDSLELAA